MHGRMFWMVFTLVVIWLSVLFTSLFASDLISGSFQEHLPIAAIITWIFGLAATRSVIKMLSRSKNPQKETDAIWMYSGISVAVIWVIVTITAIFSPVSITGSDPTRIPVAVVVAPIAGLLLTGLVGQLLESRLQS
jgi:hypothetical protein